MESRNGLIFFYFHESEWLGSHCSRPFSYVRKNSLTVNACVTIRRMHSEPLVSIVTPSYNSGLFIEQTIQSVLQQDYPRIEYLVVDGGSSDGTLSIIAKESARVKLISAGDLGTADAIRKGFLSTEGSILAWLNADDCYLPGAIRAAVQSLNENPAAGAVYAEALWVDEGGAVLGRYPSVRPYEPEMWSRECGICQPACFFRRSVYDEVGGIDGSLRTAFDYDLWIRMSRSFPFVSIPGCLAASRMHPNNLSFRLRDVVFVESIALLKRRFGYVPLNWIYGEMQYSRDRRDQFFEPLQLSLLTFLACLPVGLCYNYRHPIKYLAEYGSKVKLENLVNYLQSVFSPQDRPAKRPTKW
jgi:glycosyltransferase involved in cell wall biosynthesis